MTQDPENTLFGRYQLRRLLGEGGMGQVYLASATGSAGFEKRVALKMLGAEQAMDAGLVRSLEREALIGVQLDHENLVQILDYGEHGGRAFIAMEYVRGFSLGSVIKHTKGQGRTIPIGILVHIARKVAEALNYMHHLVDGEGRPLELIHGDVSPSNVLLATDGRIKLTDFGITALSKEIRGERAVAGKPGYLPPEALLGAPHNQAWDVYALGVVLYEGLCGRQLYPGSSLDEVREVMAAGVECVDLHRPDCPGSLCRVVERAVSQNPGLRFVSAVDLVRALDDAVPRRLDDGAEHAAWIGALFASEAFVREHGELPFTGGIGATGRLAPYITQNLPGEQDEMPTVAPRRLPALRFGLSPALGSDVAKKHGAHLAEVLSARLGRDVRVMVFGDYGTLLDCLCQGEVDFAWTPPLTFVEAAERGVGNLVIAKRRGRLTYETAIIVRADSPIQSLEDLRGQTVAWVDRASSAGYLFAAAEVARRLGPPATVFSREHFHGSYRAVCEAVANGWATAGAAYIERSESGEVLTSAWADLIPERAGELRVLECVGPIPGDGIAHRPGLPDRLLRQLVDVLSSLGSDPEGSQMIMDVFGAEELVPGRPDLYDSVLSAKLKLE